jgi:DNA-binding response OmpR family regulator
MRHDSTSKPGRILIVDDEQRWSEELAETLQRNGFSAEAVENVTEALERLSSTIYHIVVLDIRLPSDEEGLALLGELERRGLKEATKVIVHSAYGTLERMRLAFRDYEVADFVPKNDPETFLKSVQQVFAEKVKMNPALDIRWQTNRQVEQVVSNLMMNGKRVGRNISLRRQLAEELDDLLRRLFYEAEMLLVRPLTPGWSGTGVALVQPYYKDRGRGEDVIVKYGDMKDIRKEHYNFERYVRRFLSGGRSTAILDQRYTPHLGGIIYSLLGAGNDQLVDFGEFYRSAETISKITNVLDHLFQGTCANWYGNRSRVEPLDLAIDYQQFFDFTPKKLERMLISQLPSVYVKEKLTFTTLPGAHGFTNPLLHIGGQSFTRFTSTCIAHGDLNQHNLFVDRSGYTWLIDFQATGRGHILRDCATLDSVIRFQLLTASEATLEERLRMEEMLRRAEHFGQMGQLTTAFSTENQALAKAFATVIHLRMLAGNLVGQNAHDDISEYSIALFYNALNTLQFTSLEPVQREHALLCASLLADQLGLSSQQHP